MPKLQDKSAPGEPDIADTAVETDPPEEQQAGPAPAAVKKAAGAAKKAAGAVKKAAAPTPAAAAPPPIDLLGSARSLDEVTDFLSVGYYGKQGSAKTTNAAAMVNVCDGLVIFVDAESGLKKKALASHGFDTSRIMVLPDRERGQVLSYDFLEELYWQAKDRLAKEPGSIGGFVFDSLTEINQAFLSEQRNAEVAKAERLGRDRDPFFTDRADYGKVNDQLALLLRRFRDLPCHFAYTALERRDVDDDGKVVYNPAISPGLQNAAGGIPDLVGHTFMDEVGDEEQYLGMFRASGKYSGKDRYRAVPRRLINPTFSRIHAYVVGTLTEDDDPEQNSAKAARRAIKQAETEEDDE